MHIFVCTANNNSGCDTIDINNEYLKFQNNEETAEETNEDDTEIFSSENDGCFFLNIDNHIICCLMIIGQIEGHYLLPSNTKTTKYEHIIPKLVTFDSNKDIEGFLILLNTVGGDIEAGMAIAELISGLKKPTVSIILGGGHSIGIPLAVSADTSFITYSATMTIHPVRMNGMVMAVPQQFAYFQNMQERIIRFVSTHSSVSEDRFREMMLSSGKLVTDFGTVLEGVDAVKEGIIDKTGNINDALNELIKNLPSY